MNREELNIIAAGGGSHIYIQIKKWFIFRLTLKMKTPDSRYLIKQLQIAEEVINSDPQTSKR